MWNFRALIYNGTTYDLFKCFEQAILDRRVSETFSNKTVVSQNKTRRLECTRIYDFQKKKKCCISFYTMHRSYLRIFRSNCRGRAVFLGDNVQNTGTWYQRRTETPPELDIKNGDTKNMKYKKLKKKKTRSVYKKAVVTLPLSYCSGALAFDAFKILFGY